MRSARGKTRSCPTPDGAEHDDTGFHFNRAAVFLCAEEFESSQGVTICTDARGVILIFFDELRERRAIARGLPASARLSAATPRRYTSGELRVANNTSIDCAGAEHAEKFQGAGACWKRSSAEVASSSNFRSGMSLCSARKYYLRSAAAARQAFDFLIVGVHQQRDRFGRTQLFEQSRRAEPHLQ